MTRRPVRHWRGYSCGAAPSEAFSISSICAPSGAATHHTCRPLLKRSSRISAPFFLNLIKRQGFFHRRRWRRAARWRPARTGGGPGGHSWLRYLQCHVFARPDFATGGPHGGAPRGPLAGGLHGGGAPHFAMGGTASRRRALTEPRCASERGLAMGGGRPAGAASRWEAAANPWLGAIARCSRTGSSNPSPSSGESVADWTEVKATSPMRLPPRPDSLWCARRAGARRRANERRDRDI